MEVDSSDTNACGVILACGSRKLREESNERVDGMTKGVS